MEIQVFEKLWHDLTRRTRMAAMAIAMAAAMPWAPAATAGGAPPPQLPLTIAGAPFQNFGTAVAIDGDTAVVTTPYVSVGGEDGVGAAYVYVRDGAAWTLQAQLSAFDPKPFSNYGRAVAIDGDTVVVGANGADGVASSTGAAYVYTRTGAVWTQQAKLIAADGEGFSDFGMAVALSGDSVVVGAPSMFINGENVVGAAYTFVRSGNAWSQQQKLIASDGLAFDSFGNAVAIDGDTAMIAAYQASVGAASFSGAVYAFERSGGGSWSQTQKLSASDAAVEDTFGHAIALSGDSLIVGAPQPELLFGGGAGAAYVFALAGGSWTQQAKLLADDGVPDDAFGTAVGIAGDTAVVGAPYMGALAGVDLEAGAVYVYARSGGAWAQQARIRAVEGSQAAHLGRRVGLSGNTAIVGAPDARVGANEQQGKAFLFTLGAPVPAVTPGAIDFGDVAVGSTTTRRLTLRNLGTADFFSGALQLIGAAAAQYTLTGDTCNGQRIKPAATCQADISFTPSGLAAYDAQVVVPGSAGVLFVTLSGQGVAPPAQIAVTPNPIAQSLPQNQTGTLPITISHPGSEQTLQWTLTEDSSVARRRLRVLGEATAIATAATGVGAEHGAFLHARGMPGQPTRQPAGLPPVGQTLTHSTSEAITGNHSVACGNNKTGTTNANQFLRAFTLTDFGIDSAFTVSSIRFGVESLSVEMPATVNLYVLDGFMSYFNMELVATASVVLPPQTLSLVDVPISAHIPAGATLLLEVAAPDLETANGEYLPGSNAAGQTAPSYIAAADCGSGEPEELASIGFPDVHLVMSVTGESAAPAVDCALPAWLDLATQSGAVAPGGAQVVDLEFDAAGLAEGEYRATLCFASNAEDALYPVPLTLTVTDGAAIFASGFE